MGSPEPTQEPVVLENPAVQPPPDDRLIKAALLAGKKLDTALKLLAQLPTREGNAQFVHTWHIALCAMSWDNFEGAVELSVAGSLRAARTLNRSLFEYTIRAHYYTKHPQLAKSHYELATNLLRRVMKGVATYGKAEPSVDLLKEMLAEGETDAKHPKIRAMIDAMVENIGGDKSRRQEFVEYLDAEYSLSTAVAHGSPAALFDALRMTEDSQSVHRRSRSFTRTDELLRSVTTMVALMIALEREYPADFGTSEIRKRLNEIGPFAGGQTTLGRQNALKAMLRIA